MSGFSSPIHSFISLGRPRLTCSASVAQHGYATVSSFGQSQDLEKMGIGSQWDFLLRDVLVSLSWMIPVGNADGVVTGILRDVEATIGTVGLAIDAETEIGKGGLDWGRGAAATKAVKPMRQKTTRMMPRGRS